MNIIIQIWDDYIVNPLLFIYDKLITFYNQNISKNDNSYDIDIENNILRYRYYIGDQQYIMTSRLYQQHLRNIYMKIIKDLKVNKTQTTILSAQINENYNVTEYVQKMSGPFGDFYKQYGCNLTVKDIIPNNYINEFKYLNIIDDKANFYNYKSLQDLVILNNTTS